MESTTKEVWSNAMTPQVASRGRPLHYFVELSKRFLLEHGEVQLSGIGLAIPHAVNVSQILTTYDFATELRECIYSSCTRCLEA